MDHLVLASQSPRRKQILQWAEIDFEVIVGNAEETFPLELAIVDVPVYIARKKALAVKKLLKKDCTILAADTVVVLDGQIIGKPRDRKEAVDILSGLAGKRHEVITGVVLMKGERETTFNEMTAVWFHPLSIMEIEYYVDKYQPYDKAGAYAIQEWIGIVGIKSIHGDFYNVMGLPISRVINELKNWD
jgi:septum formation protein